MGIAATVTTQQLQALLEAGVSVRLPRVARPEMDVLEHYEHLDTVHLSEMGSGAEVVSVEQVGSEQVQCISVDHPQHRYLTDWFMPTHNTSNIVFLKSTDDSMIDTLQKMSGTRHVSYIDSKTVRKDKSKVVKGLSVDSDVSYTMSTKEEPVISYNDMAFISERNSIVFRAGDAPVWNRNETILPMSWKMFGGSGDESIIHPGHQYSLQTIPTLSSALDFDVRMNQPDFNKMLAKRMEQAILSKDCAAKYKKAFGYSDLDVTRLDPDEYSDQVMELVDAQMREELAAETGEDPDEIDLDEFGDFLEMLADAEEDVAMRQEMDTRTQKDAEYTAKRYAQGRISRQDLVQRDGTTAVRGLEQEIVEAYRRCGRDMARDLENFSVDGAGSLRSADGSQVFISRLDEAEVLEHLKSSASAENDRVFTEDPSHIDELVSYRVHDEFFRFLATQPTWVGLADGEFERSMRLLMDEADVDSLV